MSNRSNAQLPGHGGRTINRIFRDPKLLCVPLTWSVKTLARRFNILRMELEDLSHDVVQGASRSADFTV